MSFPCVKEMVSKAAMGPGLNSGSCDTGQLVISEALAAAMHMNKCGYAIFADVSTAFASPHRNLALMTDADSDEIWAKHLERCGFTAAQAKDIISMACDVLTWEEAGSSVHAF